MPTAAHPVSTYLKCHLEQDRTIISLDEMVVKNNLGFSAIIFDDLKGAFETVSHLTMDKYISIFHKTLGKITLSYLTNRSAQIYNEKYTNDKPKLKYLKTEAPHREAKLAQQYFRIIQDSSLNGLSIYVAIQPERESIVLRWFMPMTRPYF